MQPDSNVSSCRSPQEAKQDLEMASTEEGLQIDDSEKQSEKAWPPTRKSEDTGSNVTVDSPELLEQQPLHK
jgi:hypothetical protein